MNDFFIKFEKYIHAAFSAFTAFKIINLFLNELEEQYELIVSITLCLLSFN